MTTPLLINRRQFFLKDNKWHVRTVRSKRRERILRDLFLGCYDGAAAENLCHGAGSDRDDETERSLNGCDGFNALTTQNSTLQLKIGSNNKIWLDFGSDQQNTVGGRRTLPVILCAPGNTEEVDHLIYFDVKLETSPSLSLCLDEANVDSNNSNAIEFTIKEGVCQIVHVTWIPSHVGGLRELIRVTATFNGTQEIVAQEEIIVVGSARTAVADSEAIMYPENVVRHHDLAQSPLDQCGKQGDLLEDIRDTDDSRELSNISEEGSQHDLDNSGIMAQEGMFQSLETVIDSYNGMDDGLDNKTTIKSSGTESPLPKNTSNLHQQQHQHQHQQQQQHQHNFNQGTPGNISQIRSSRIQSSTVTTTTTHHQVQNYSIQHTLSKARAQRATASSAPRDRRGRPLRPTHPLVATNRTGLSNRAELLRYNRYTRAQPNRQVVGMLAVQQSSVGVESAQNLEQNQNVQEAQNNEHFQDEENAKAVDEATFDSPKDECQEDETKSSHHSGSSASHHSDSSSYSDLKDDVAERRFDSPTTMTMLEKMVDISVEVDEDKLTSSSTFSVENEKAHDQASPSSLADEISEMREYLTPSPGQSPTLDDNTDSTDKPKSLTFGEDQTRLHSQDRQADDAVTPPGVSSASDSYQNATNELNDTLNESNDTLNSKDETEPTERSNTPLKDLHDQINSIISAQKSVSPSKKIVDLTPEPDFVVPLNINGPSLTMPKSEPKNSVSSNKPETPSSIVRSSLYKDIHQTDTRKAARKSARQLYFFKSPRKSTDERSVRSETLKKKSKKKDGKDSVSRDDTNVTYHTPERILKRSTHKEDTETNEPKDTVGGDSSLSPKSSKAETHNKYRANSGEKQCVEDEAQTNATKDSSETKHHKGDKSKSKTTSIPKPRKTNSFHEAITDSESDYKSRIQAIRKSRSNNYLSNAGLDDTPDQSSEGIPHPRPTAKNAARKLYFFKSPTEPQTAKGRDSSRIASESFVAKAAPPPKVRRSLPATQAKSLVSLPAPVLSAREQMAIDKHVQIMKKNSSRKSIA